jgi:hypothetical protein
VTSHIFQAIPKKRAVLAIDYKKRSEYLIQYDAEDASGNKAETLHFVLVLNDVSPPSFSAFKPTSLWKLENPEKPYSRRYTLEHALIQQNDLKLHRFITATDNVDGSVPVKHSDSKLDKKLGDFSFHYTAHDHAGIFGVAGKDNIGTSKTFSLKVRPGCMHSTSDG